MKTRKIEIEDLVAYLQGNIRYFLVKYFKGFGVRKTLLEQVKYRSKSLAVGCEIECQKCGCPTHKTVYSNRSCKGNCYPTFVPKEVFEEAKLKGFMHQGNITWFMKLDVQKYVKL